MTMALTILFFLLYQIRKIHKYPEAPPEESQTPRLRSVWNKMPIILPNTTQRFMDHVLTQRFHGERKSSSSLQHRLSIS
ncbi:hypothetical protein BEN47_10785 [Hymenobacter lapidarius]|uniref:Uncharacterized protein n=1 Tax=Hymenobacter lapidarius TaxID=1908237 RepID=A0A1G1T958_9BACT|nr:hypothetical protein BEN47_10785 [Hymenobacter lapidarius]